MQASFIKIIDMETLEVLYWERHDFAGPADQCKASDQEKQILGQQMGFYRQLRDTFSKQFANQNNILDALKSTFQPILNAGPGQFGFTPEETAAMRTRATEQIAGQYKTASTAVRESMAARGAGNAFLPSGASDQVEAEIATAAAGREADTQNQITEAGYQQGRENFYKASAILGDVSKEYNPLGYAGAADQSSSGLFGEANTINQQDNAWKGQLGGVLGEIAGS